MASDGPRTRRKLVEEVAASYFATHPKGERGVHRYDPAFVGLAAGEIRERSSNYGERYDIPT